MVYYVSYIYYWTYLIDEDRINWDGFNQKFKNICIWLGLDVDDYWFETKNSIKIEFLKKLKLPKYSQSIVIMTL